MEHNVVSIGQIRNNFKKHIDMIFDNTELCLVVTKRLNQFVLADDRFFCVMSGDMYMELLETVYGKDERKRVEKKLTELSGQTLTFEEN